MKELSIEEKARAYDEAIAHAKMLLKTIGNATLGNLVLKNEFERMFPELAESEDEKIRKDILTYLLQSANSATLKVNAQKFNKWIAWLEKQGEHANFRNKIQIGDKVIRNEDGVLVNLSQLNRVAKKDEKQGEKNLVKANEEWYDFIRWFVKERTDNYTLIPSDDDIHKWGDMILNHAQKIFEKQGEQKPYGQREECSDCEFRCGDKCIGSCAMKRGEQKPEMTPKFKVGDTIWKKSDHSNKITISSIDEYFYYANSYNIIIDIADNDWELVEQKLAWSEEDEKMYNVVHDLAWESYKTSRRLDIPTFGIINDWLKSLKDRVQPQPQQEWSEEDKCMINNVIDTLKPLSQTTHSGYAINNMIDWLKSLRPQNRWKPSKEQINALSITVKHGCTDDKEALGELLEQLKAL